MSIFRLLPFFLLIASTAGADPATEMRALGNCGGCVIESGDFSGSRLVGIDLSDANVSNVSFAQANMSIAVLDNATLVGVSFEGADLSGASFVNARLSNVDFTDADLAGAVFEGANLEDSDLTVARLCKTQMPDDDMGNANCGDG